MDGEINVSEIIDRAARLRAWHDRQQRDAEWAALKQWWIAEKKVQTATDGPELKSALALRSQTAHLYQAELQRTWPKWAAMQQDRAERRSAQNHARISSAKRPARLPGTSATID